MESGGSGMGERPIRMPKKAMKVKNKAPAPVQITAEQLLREAKERDLEILPPPPRQKISDPEELKEYQLKRRKEFEDNIRKNSHSVPNWIKYAKWEESQGELQRARSIFERALDIDHRIISMWLQYAEMEIRNRQINHARNIWDRVISILPRVTQFWLKYTYMEEMLGNVAGCRQVFERWMEWEPSEQAWQTYINFELRYKEIERARQIWQRYLHVHGEPVNWIRYAKFEERHGFVENARQVFERAVDYFGADHADEKLLLAFARFEEGQKEHDRARTIYKYALDHLSKEKAADIYKAYSVHEKKFGERAGIESVIVSKRRQQYEDAVAENSYNYDAWFDYLRMMESEKAEDLDSVREVYERAIANVPLEQEKRFWRRYIYFWINYALYEELHAKDPERTRQVYKTCLQLIPHKKFTFAKIWLWYAQFEVRQKDLKAARKILGHAIGACAKDKLFRGYIDLELQLREFDRCRILYEKFLECAPENCTTWIKFAELETLLGDSERARAIYELAVAQNILDMPEVLWKSYIDFQVAEEEFDKARRLYDRLLQRTEHVKVWLSFAQFELLHSGEGSDAEKAENARKIYRKANSTLRSSSAEKEERMVLLETWKQFEADNGTEETMKEVEKEMPKRVKKRRPVKASDGSDAGWEEYFDYIFPSDEPAQSNLKLLAMAKKWKQKADVADDTQQTEGQSQAPAQPADEQELEKDTDKIEDSAGKEDKIREGDSDTDIDESDEDEEDSKDESGSEK